MGTENWTVRAKVLRQGSKEACADGYCVYTDLIDEKGTKMRLLAYNNIDDQFELHSGIEYYFSKCELERVIYPTEHQKCDMVLTMRSEVEECTDLRTDDTRASGNKIDVKMFHFVGISNIDRFIAINFE